MSGDSNPKETSDPKNVNFTNRNAVEKFLEGEQFRPCENLKCFPAELPHQMVYLPTCVENRFHREGIAEHLDMPQPPRPLSPMTYTSVGIWAPLISCPTDCRGYKSRTVAKLERAGSSAIRLLARKGPLKNSGNGQEKKWWELWWGQSIILILTGVVAGLIIWAITRHYDRPKTLTNIEQRKAPPPVDTPAEPSPSVPSVKQPRPKPKVPIADKKVEKPGDGNTTLPGNITTGPCSNVQVGGSNNQASTNCGPPPPPPLEMKWRVSDKSGDQKHPYEKMVTVTVNVPLSPVAIGVQCSAPVEEISFANHNGMAATNARTFSEGNVAFVYFEGTQLTANDELYISLKSSKPFLVVQVGQAKIKGLND